MHIVLCTKVKIIIEKKKRKLCMQYKLIVKLPITIDCKLVRKNISNIYIMFFFINLKCTRAFKYILYVHYK